MKSEIAILDFGSSKITCFVGLPTQDGFIIKSTGQSKYAGFSNSEWYEPQKLNEAVEFAIKQAEDSLDSKIKNVFVGVPGEFSAVATSEASLTFRSAKKITKEDVDELFVKANIFTKSDCARMINRSSIYYTLDDDRHLADPVGCVSSKLIGLVSYIFVAENFRSSVSEVLRKLDIDATDYISNCLAEALYLIEPLSCEDTAILVDIGYLSTNIMVTEGDGLLFLRSFSLGSAYINSDLSQVLEIAFPLAEQLLTKINLNLDFEENDTYILSSGAGVKAKLSNDIVRARIEDMSQYIIKCIEECEYALGVKTPVFLTGGGLTYIKGGVDYLGTVLGKPFKIAKPLDPQYNRNEYMSSYGLLDIAVKQNRRKKFRFRI